MHGTITPVYSQFQAPYIALNYSTITTHSKAKHLCSPFQLIRLSPQRNYQIHRSFRHHGCQPARRGVLENQLSNWPATHTFKAQGLLCRH